MEKKKESFLFKKLDLVFVYLFIFFIGIAMVVSMTTYINSQVKQFNEDIVVSK